MPISSNRYVDITSGVGGATAVNARELKLRLYTTNELVPTGSVINFTNVDSVLDYFGDSASEEYLQAQYYFGFISKVITSPSNIQFARWADVATSSQIFGTTPAALATLNTYSAAAFDVTIGGVTANVTGIDLSLDASFADVATEIQTQMVAAGGVLASATVVYNATRGAFEFDSNITDDGAISLTAVTANFLDDIGWTGQAILSDGIAAQTLTELVTDATEIDNNYGSFAFIPAIDVTQATELSTWNQTRNIEFQLHVKVEAVDASAFSTALIGITGTGITLYDPANNDYPWLLPCALLASQQFDKAAASANYNFQPDSRLTATVTTDLDADLYDGLRVNYYGQTQEAGTLLEFYQRGRLTGGSTAPIAMGVYANEQWFKATLKAEFLNMFLAFQQVPADDTGIAIGYAYIDPVIAQGKANGAIATGKPLTTTQQQFITSLTGDANAWRDVASKGWWRTIVITQEAAPGGGTQFVLDYTIVYSKRDSIDKVEGRHVLI